MVKSYLMKAQIHPQYFGNAQAVCSCGNQFVIGSTKETIHVELCNKCHPFYTGQQKFVDTASRIEKFEARKKLIQIKKVKVDQEKKDDSTPKTLREMLQALRK